MNERKLTLEDLVEPIQTPEILEAEWALDQVLQLFEDLEAGAEVEHVQLKTRESDTEVPLIAAKSAFERGLAVAIQVRYFFDNEHWCDTIMPGSPTTKIIRSRIQTTSERTR